MYLTDEALLQALQEERDRFSQSDPEKIRYLVDKLIEREVYPAETVPGNPNTVLKMVEGYGAYWHIWRTPLACPHCEKDLRDLEHGPPFKLELGRYDRDKDRTTDVLCPSCEKSVL